MNKKLLIICFALFVTASAYAQKKEKIPPPPPPQQPKIDKTIEPPPPPPEPPITVEGIPPAIVKDDYKEFMDRNPDVKGIAWKDDANVVIITTKNGKRQSFNLDIDEDARKLNEKFGKLPSPPPPPPKEPQPVKANN